MLYKSKYLVLLSILCVALTSCAKKSDNVATHPPDEQVVNNSLDAIEQQDETIDITNEQELVENIVDYSSFFGDVAGSAVFYNPNDSTIDVYQKDIANEPHSPCSTFKIISSLIGMECEVIGYESNTRKWSGEKFWNNAWNTDISFIDAFQSSCVWYFRDVTNEIGKENIQKFLDELNYGNTDISDWQGKLNSNNSNPALTGFWIESSLLITPIEQTKVLARIFEPGSTYSQQSLDLLTTAMLVQDNGEIKIYGKTGTGKLGNTLLDAWFVGFFTQNNENVYFAVYLSETDNQEISSSTAKSIGLEIISNVYG